MNPPLKPSKHNYLLLIAGLAGLAIGLNVYLFTELGRGKPRPPSSSISSLGIGGPYTLVDHTGKVTTEKTYDGQVRLVFFGFTYCPDVCPTALTEIGALLDQIGDRAKEVQPLFITVDPERDTASQLAGYVTYFHPSIIGLTGSPEQIAIAARAYRAYYEKIGTGDTYRMAHPASIFVMGRDGAFRGTLDPHEPAETKLAKLVRALDEK